MSGLAVIQVARRKNDKEIDPKKDGIEGEGTTYAIKMSEKVWDGFKQAVEKWYLTEGVEIKWEYYDV